MNNNRSMPAETFTFKAEINQLLSLIINTFYSNKEVFLRELISNACDAIDKSRFSYLKANKPLPEYSIKISFDKDGSNLIIEDNGIGMSRDELIENLGTIAHSGTRKFMETLESGNADISLIGQFGVGFYSAYLVADKVTVWSKHEDNTTYVWESYANGTYDVSDSVNDLGHHGTRIMMHLKEDQKEYLQDARIIDIVNKHSQYIDYPILLLVEKEVTKEEADAEAKADADADTETKAEDEEGKVEEEKEPEPPKTELVWDRVNKHAPIWQRKPEEVKQEEYDEFYKSFSNDWEVPLFTKHLNVEGTVEFKALLFIPKHPPFDMFSTQKKMNNIKLYVKKVLIMDESNEIMPDYLSFIKGVVDSNDLPLNVSREMLQENSIMKIIKKNLVKKSIEAIGEIMEDEEKARIFNNAFMKNVKYGYIEDTKNRDKLRELIRFNSSFCKTDEDITSLAEYVSRMKEGQKDIYFVTGDNLTNIKNMACIEKVLAKGYEVLYMCDPLDEYLVQQLADYKDHKMVNCTKEGLDLDKDEDVIKEWEKTCEKIKEILGTSKVKEVKVTSRLVQRPCVLVSDAYGWTANMERIMKAQALRNKDPYMGMNNVRKIMEINPEHNIMQTIKTRLEKNADDIGIKKIIHILYDTVCLDSGFSLDDPSKYTSQIYNLIELGASGEEQCEEPLDITQTCDDHEEPEPPPVSTMEEVD
jgi:molecular chaperone HtpG